MDKEEMVKKLNYSGLAGLDLIRKLTMRLENVTTTSALSEDTVKSLYRLMEEFEHLNRERHQSQKRSRQTRDTLEIKNMELKRAIETLDTINTLRKMIHYDE